MSDLSETTWYNSSYLKCKPITINNGLVATTSSAFPILATTTDAELKTTTHGGIVENDNGFDIIFTSLSGADCATAGSLLDYEIEEYASTTGTGVWWIETAISSTTDKYIGM